MSIMDPGPHGRNVSPPRWTDGEDFDLSDVPAWIPPDRVREILKDPKHFLTAKEAAHYSPDDLRRLQRRIERHERDFKIVEIDCKIAKAREYMAKTMRYIRWAQKVRAKLEGQEP